ncbi:serine hydrolase [Candidatus Xianfuyuplasma coldseepsis]|uniref:Serine hydrolase n=1 Tax=Candidatus Xianfuyuplasma coldseepsis TaxID=2782163 RepID=A0A7L7KTJ1_9MOLU|nr:serine hydrolase [Xianfuyuplasma coldseepsis]QMS85284.1 serine hydrolase [Xianfuyuplasma coldseepsis]
MKKAALLFALWLIVLISGCETELTIEFETNGGPVIDSITLLEGTSPTLPDDPTKEGYIFVGWYVDDTFEEAFDDTTTVSTNLTLYAKWEMPLRTLTFLDFDNSVLNTFTYETGDDLSALSAPTVEREGYEFTGWDVIVPDTMPAGDLTIIAQYQVRQYTIEFHDIDGNVISSDQIDFGQDLTIYEVPAIPERDGYASISWTSMLPNTMPSQNIVLEPVYEMLTYTLLFEDYDNTIIQTNQVPYQADLQTYYGDLHPSREGYEFIGWDISISQTMPLEDLVVTAVYQILSFTLEFQDHDGTVLSSQLVEYGTDLTLFNLPDIPEREGYSTVGWNGTLPDIMPANSIIMTAQYDIEMYTIQFLDVDGTVMLEIIEEYSTDLSEVVIDDPTKEGLTFLGWYLDDLFIKECEFDSMLRQDITLYSKWETLFQTSINSFVNNVEFNGSILIYKDNETLLSEGYGWANTVEKIENTPETTFLIGSITKQFTAVAIMMLYEDGLLTVDDTIDMYIPDFPNGDIITIHHLLTHTSGLENYLIHIPRDEEYLTSYHSPLSLINIIRSYPLAFTPGEEFEYSNTNYLILGYIIEVITEITYQEFMQQNIFDPLGMENTGFSTLDPESTEALGYDRILYGRGVAVDRRHNSISYSSGSMASTTGDLLLWHHALMNYTLITEETTNLIYTPYTDPTYNTEGYGYGWHILSTDGTVKLFHSGDSQRFITYFYRNTGADLAIVIISNEYDTNMEEILWHIFEKLTEFGYSDYVV